MEPFVATGLHQYIGAVEKLEQELISARINKPDQYVAVLKRKIYILQQQLATVDPKQFGGVDLWLQNAELLAKAQLGPNKKLDDYRKFADTLISSATAQKRYIVNRNTGQKYILDDVTGIFMPARTNPFLPTTSVNPFLPVEKPYNMVVSRIADRLVAWGDLQDATNDFYGVDVQDGMQNMLQQNQIFFSEILISQTLMPFHPTTADEITYVALGFVPLLGNGIALAEVLSGKDGFDRPLSDIQRGLSAVGILLPFLGRFAIAGKVLRSAKWISKFYGGAEHAWASIVASGVTLTADSHLWNVLTSSVNHMSETGRVLQEIIPSLVVAFGTLITVVKKSIDSNNAFKYLRAPALKPVLRLLENIGDRFAIMKNVDPYYLFNLLNDASKRSDQTMFIRTRLFEKFAETKLVPLLQNKIGIATLDHGFSRFPKEAASKLEYLAHTLKKHLIYYPHEYQISINGQSITDGIIGYYENHTFVITHIIEVKSGSNGLWELTSGTFSQLVNDYNRLGKGAKILIGEVIKRDVIMAKDITFISLATKNSDTLKKVAGAQKRFSKAFAGTSAHLEIWMVDITTKEMDEIALSLNKFVNSVGEYFKSIGM